MKGLVAILFYPNKGGSRLEDLKNNDNSKKLNLFRKITDGLVNFMQKYLPSSFVLAIALAVVVFIVGILLTDTTPLEMVGFAGKGTFELLAFTMQMVLILVTGHALANSPIVLKLLRGLARIPKNRVSAVAFTAFASYLATYLHWGFGLVAGALLAKEIATINYGKKIHYPILVAAAYSGNLARGPSSSIFLGPTSAGHAAESITGIIPLSDTLLMPENIIMTIVLLIAIPVVYYFMTPSAEDSLEIDASILENDRLEGVATEKFHEESKASATFADKMDNSKILLYLFTAILFIYTLIYFLEIGFLGLDINTIILIFLVLGLFAHGTPNRYAKALKSATATADSMILQFPIYAAIMVMLRDTGMASSISDFFIEVSTATTLPLYTFFSSSLINLFIPSGGGLWAIQGPIALEAAVKLNASVEATMVGLAWGDTWSSQIQPFWALPLLAIAGLDVKDIMGYCAMIFFVSGIIISGFLLIM